MINDENWNEYVSVELKTNENRNKCRLRKKVIFFCFLFKVCVCLKTKAMKYFNLFFLSIFAYFIIKTTQ